MLITGLEKVFNISAHEFPKTACTWVIQFFQRAGFIIGWTTMVALFVSRFSIQSLPFLFLIQAVLTMFGMFLYSLFIERFPSKTLVMGSAFIIGILLFTSTFFVDNSIVFFGLLFVVFGIFMPQLTIFLANFIEDLFTPLECERTNPVIESAQTIGGIVAGLIIASFSSSIGSYKFFYIWILFLFFMVVLLFLLKPFASNYIHVLKEKTHNHSHAQSKFEKIRQSIAQIKHLPFLQGLLLIFLLHWVFAYLLEYQYTKVIEESIGHSASLQSHEENLAHGLGSFHILFHSSALVVQLLLASRIARKLGTVGGVLLHGIVTFLSAISLLFGFGYFTLILAKNNFEVSGIVHKNAYEGSYYALKHGTQRNIREFFEAFLYPIGTIMGTFVLLLVQFFFLEHHSNLVLQFILVFLALMMVLFGLKLQRGYTHLSEENLLNTDHKISKFHAIEILSQKGHHNSVDILVKALRNPKEVHEVRLKILESLGKMGHIKAIPILLTFLKDSDVTLVLAATRALGNFPAFGKEIFQEGFSYYTTIKALKDLFLTTHDDDVRVAVIHALVQLKYDQIVPMLLDALQHSSVQLTAACIKVFSFFHDPAIIGVLEPYLKDENPFVRAQTIMALWQFKQFRRNLQLIIKTMLASPKREETLAICSVIGDLQGYDHKKLLIPFLTVLDPELRLYAAFSLLRFGYKEAGIYSVHLLFSRNSVVLKKAQQLLVHLKPDFKRHLLALVQREISSRLHKFFLNSEDMFKHLEKLDNDLLERFKDAFMTLGAYAEAEYIESLLAHRRSNPVNSSNAMELVLAPVVIQSS